MNASPAIPMCPKCKGLLQSGDLNVATDIAFCRVCNVPHAFSAIVHGSNLESTTDLQHPPAGAWYRSSGLETVIGATHRSVGAALGLLAFSLFWNGIVSIFVLFAVAGTLVNFGIPAPEWFPAPKMNGNLLGAGMTIFLWLFLTPFIAIGLAMI